MRSKCTMLETEMSTKTQILTLASQLPSGLNDPRARQKLEAEKCELREELAKGDKVGALLEAGDCLYYIVKARHNKQLSSFGVFIEAMKLTFVSGFTIEQIEKACIAKYTLRARPGNPKNDREERAAVDNLI